MRSTVLAIHCVQLCAIVGLYPSCARTQDRIPRESVVYPDIAVLETVTVTATRTPTGPGRSLSGSSVIGSDEINLRHLNATLPDILKGIPGVSTQISADDPGVAINLRGLQDFGRVNVLVDGARQNFQKNGHEANGTFYVDTEFLKSIDITRGPVSTIYGSGAIGGVVSLTTIDADDLLRGNAFRGGRIKTAYDYNGSGPMVHAAYATKFGDASDMLVGGTFRKLDDYKSGDNERINSSQMLKSGLAKWHYSVDDVHKFSLSGSRYFNTFENGSVATRSTDVTADTIKGVYTFKPDSNLLDLSLGSYRTSTTFEQSLPDGSALEQSFRVKTAGSDVFNTSRFDTGELSHELTYGADIFIDNVRTVDGFGSSDDLTPSGRRKAYGSYVQNQVRYETWLELIAALRYDAYSLTNDIIYTDGRRFSPKLTLGLSPTDSFTAYGTYAEGYRAPALTETVIDGIHPPPVPGRFFPNPALRPEVARTYEIGVNLDYQGLLHDSDDVKAKLSIFQNDVQDYIDQVFLRFPIPGGYQYRNVARAQIRGAEFELNYNSSAFFATVGAQVLSGKDIISGKALQKVPPRKAVISMGFYALDGALTIGSRVTAVAGKTGGHSSGFLGEPYGVVDLFGQIEVVEDYKINLALNNVFDRSYIQYLNADPNVGFNAKLSVIANF